MDFFAVWIVVLVRKLQLIVNERGWPSFPTSRSRSASMLKKLAIPDGYQPRGSHLIKRKIDALFIIALRQLGRTPNPIIGLGADLRAVGQLLCGAPLNTAGETMFDS
jgi:hypothetical protein